MDEQTTNALIQEKAKVFGKAITDYMEQEIAGRKIMGLEIHAMSIALAAAFASLAAAAIEQTSSARLKKEASISLNHTLDRLNENISELTGPYKDEHH